MSHVTRELVIVSVIRSLAAMTALHAACRASDASLVRELLARGDCHVDALNAQHRSALHEAVGSVECARLLLDHGADVESFKHGEWTPLMTAASRGRADVVALLLSYGADPLLPNRDGWNAIHVACRAGHDDVAHILLDAAPPSATAAATRNGTTAIATAALHGHVEILCLLLARGGDPAAGDASGCTPLMKAALGGRPEALRVLLGALRDEDVVARDGAGRTAAHYAAMGEDAACMRMLARHRLGPAIVAARDTTSQWTPAHCAAREGRTEVIKAMKELGVPTDALDYKGHAPAVIGARYVWTSFCLTCDAAAQFGRSEAARLLSI